MDENQEGRRVPYRAGKIWAGLFVILVGCVLLLDQMGFPLPDWLFSWHILLVAVGLFIGLRHNFRGGAWLILMLVGGVFIIQDYYPHTEIHRFILPGVLILVGLLIMLRPKRSWHNTWRQEWENEKWAAKMHEWKHRHHRHWDRRFGPGGPWVTPNNPSANPDPANPNPGNPTDQAANPGSTGPTPGSNYNYNYDYNKKYSSDDFIDTTSIFGGVHKKVVSKNFKGGDITTFLGGTEIDLSQADFNGVARLDVTQIMGGTKIIVPAHWEVRTEVSAIFAGFEDKRQQPAILNPEKILIIDGTSVFGGIELKNF
jgi:predicted membrane protein